MPAAAQVRINTKPDLPGATVGRSYTVQLVAGGGLDPYSFTLASGVLPAGITLSPLGVIAGTPGATGLFNLGVKVTDGRGDGITKQYRLRVEATPVTVVAEARVDTPVGVALSKTINATGGAGSPYRISLLSGSLPPGMNFRKENVAVAQAVVSGTPFKEGSYSAVFEARDSGGRTGTATMVFNVAANPLRVLSFTLPDGRVGEDYEFDVPVQGFAPVRCTATANLPSGLLLTAGCRLRGVPGAAGPLNLRATATDGAGGSINITATAQVTVPQALTIMTKSPLPAGGAGRAYRKQILFAGGTATSSATPRWAVTSGSLPGGLQLSATDGTVSGTPSAAGNFRFTVEYSGPQGVASKVFDLAVGTAYTWVTPEEMGTMTGGQVSSLPTGNFQGGTPAGPPHLVTGAWPPGLTGQGDGTLAGTPATPGSYYFTLESKSADGQVVQREFHITVQQAQPLGILTRTANLPDAIAGIPYFFADYAPACSCAANNGAHPYRWQDEPGNLPPGLTTYADGEVSGTPRTPGTYNFALILTDGAGRSVSQRYTIKVQPFVGTLSLLPASTTLPNGTGGLPYSYQFGASGGASPYAYSASPIPAFLAMSGSGVLSAASAVLGAHQIGVTVRDSQPEDLGGPLSVSKNYDLFVAPVQAPVITRLDPVNVVAGSPAIQLNVFGANFTVNSFVVWNGAIRPPTRLVSSTQLVATVPANLLQDAGVAKITVMDGTLVSNTVDFPILGQPPQLSQLLPGGTPAGSATFTLTVAGANFVQGAAVRWNNAALPTTWVSTSRMTATVSANLVGSAGSATVTITNPDGQTSNPVTFVISPALAPQISSLSPPTATAGGAAFTLTVNGANFQGTASVRWNGAALSTSFLSTSQLTADVPATLIANAGNASITVLNSDGQVSGAAVFVINPAPAPVITGLNPVSTIAGGGSFTLTVNGLNFVSGSSVRWSGTPLPTTYVAANQLTALVPPNLIANSGSANITVLNPDTQASTSVAFTINPAPAPTISSLNPTSTQAGGAGFTLTVNGANFVNGSAVRWAGGALPTAYVSATQLTASVGASQIASAGPAAITVANPDGQVSAGVNFTVNPAPAPQITTLSPSSAQVGGQGFTLTVNGANFVTGAAVRWNGAALLTNYISATQLTASVASNLIAAVGQASITVLNQDGQNSNAATFTISPAPAPQITGLNPTSATAGGAGFTLTVTGANFVAGAVINWNGAPLQTAFGSATQLSAAISASQIAAAGTASVSVTNQDGQNSNAVAFAINPAPAPQISLLSPSSAVAGGAGFTLTVNGANFVSTSAIRWNGTALQTAFGSATQLSAAISASQIAAAGSVSVTVSNPDGQISGAATFTINPAPAPQISSLNPNSAVAGGAGFTLTVNGANFANTSAIRWNGTALQTAFGSATQLSASITASQIATAGSASVTVANADGQVSGAATFTINAPPAPQISSLSPNSAVAGGAGFTLTVNGANFENTSAIRWNGAALQTAFGSATQLSAAITASQIATAGSASVTVANADGQVSGAATFTINPAPAPQISSLNPSSAVAGAAGFTLTVNGANFVSTSAIRWNGTALQTQFGSATQLSAAITASQIAAAGSASVTVANPDGQISSAATFTINPAPAPQITSLNPTSVVAGGPAFNLTVTGANFVSTSVIRWNGNAVTTAFGSATQLTAQIAPSLIATAGPVSITVLNLDGQTSAASTFTVSQPAAPQITSLSPATVQAGGATFTLTVNGANFVSSSSIRWNGTGLTTTFGSATQLSASISASQIASAGSAAVTVSNPDGQVSGPATLTITPAPAPQITSLNPTSVQAGGAAFTLTVTGANFVNTSAIRWNGTALTTAFGSATQLTAQIAANLIATAGSASITVANPDGQISAASTLTINPAAAPQITSLNPTTVQAGGAAFTLTVTGANFVSNSAIRWNGTPVGTTFGSATQLTAQIAVSLIATAGSASITVANPDGQVSAASTLAINAPPVPQITSLSPTSAVAGGAAFVLTVNGSNFNGSSVVKWNGTDLATSFVSVTQLTASVGASLIAAAGTAQVTVANADGQTSTARTFAITAAAPQISSLSPASAIAGGAAFTLTVNGSGFQNTSVVRWNGNAIPTTYQSASQLTASVAATLISATGTASVTVANVDSQVSGPAAFTINPAPAPQITSLSPLSVQAGSPSFTLTVNGANFVQNAAVRWNATGINTAFVSATQLTATVPANLILTAGTANITVINPDGQLSPAAAFTISQPAAPQITSLNPASVQAGGQGFLLTVTGANYVNGSVIRWNGTDQATNFISAGQLTAPIGAGLIAAAGTVTVSVFNPDGQTATAQFQVIAPPPQLTSINPTSVVTGGPAFTVTANGSGYQSTSVVRWNGSPLLTAFLSANQLTAQVPANLIASAGAAAITVLNQDGQATAALTLAITLPPPVISSLNPPSADAGGAEFPLIVTGTGFVAGSIVRWNGSGLSTAPGTATQLTATVPAPLIASAGPVTITVLNPDGQVSQAVMFPIALVDPPQISSLLPPSAQAGGAAFTLRVNGGGFRSGAVVRWNTTTLTTTFGSESQVMASVPASLIVSPGTANVQVVNPDNQVAGAATFTITPAAVPQISSVNPTSATAGGAAFALTVNGSGFGNGAAVRWNGTALPTTYVSATQLVAQVGANLIASAGSVPLTVRNADGQVSANFSYTVSAQAPQISGLSPNSAQAGGAGFTLTVNGSFFQNGAVVRWNGVAQSTTFVSATQLTATIAAGLIATPGSVVVAVLNGDGQNSGTSTFTISQGPAPQITGVNPPGATAGGAAVTLTITGLNFNSGSAVRFNNGSLSTNFVSSTQLTALVPASLIASTGAAAILVANPDGQMSATYSFNVELAPKPEISALTPNTAAVRSAGFTLAVAGRNFQNGAAVQWNGTPVQTTFVSLGQVTAQIPGNLLGTPGTAHVTVGNPDGQTSAPANFTVTARPPQITTLNPSSTAAGGAAFTLNIRGTDFAAGAAARWNGNLLTTTFVSDSELSAAVPANLIATAGAVPVTVTNADGQTSGMANFTVTPAAAPTITSLAPNTARALSAAFDLTVQGTGFQGGSVVKWAGGALATTFVSATQLTARVTANLLAAAGTANVTVTNADGQNSAAAAFTITPAAAPSISSLNPNSAQAGSPGFTLVVNGADLQSGAVVRWNGTALSTTHISSTQVSAPVSAALTASAGTVNVTVANPDGQTSPASPFTITALPPQITLLTPGSAQAAGAAFNLGVTGLNFQSGATVRWNDTALGTTFGSATQLTAAIPANLIATAGTATIVVANPDGQNSAAVNFSIGAAPAPLISGLNPGSATAGGAGFNLTVAGANFQASAVVRWNGAPLNVTQSSTTQLTAAVPANLIATVGTATIVVANPDGQTSAPATFTIAAPAPQISSLNPNNVAATTGTFTMTVSGSAFQSGAVVRWAGSSLSTAFVSAAQLTASVPAALITDQGTVMVSVKNPDGQVSGDVVFTITAPPRPVIISVNPPSAPAGGSTIITVNGGNFNPGSVVNVGGNPLQTSFVSPTQVTATVPAPVVGSVTVTVKNPDGQVSDPVTFTITPPGPSLFTITPSSLQAGGPDTTITATGLNFRQNVELRWNGTPLATNFISATQITAAVPASLTAAPGTVFLTARNPDGGVSGALTYSVLGVPPVVTTLVPASAPAGSPALTLVLTGDGFVKSTEVLWNGTALATTFVGPTQVTAQVGADLLLRAATVSVGVRNADLQQSNSLRFTISEVNTPEITRLNPASGIVGSPAFVLAVTGLNFQPDSQVLWNGAALTTTYISATQLTATVAASLLTAKASVPVTVRNQGGRISQPVTFDIGDALRQVTQTLPDAQTGKSYKTALDATGGTKPYRWGLMPGAKLPAGLALTADGSLEGTPTEAGEFFFEIEVRDAATGSDRHRFRLLVSDKALEITNASPLPGGTAGVPYVVRFQVNDTIEGLNWSLIDGALPAGLSLDPNTGELAGTPAEPAEATSDPRIFTFRIEVSTGDRTARKTFDLVVDPQRGGLRISTASILPAARVGRPYLARVAAVGGIMPYVFSLDGGQLPAGLTVTPDGGIEGTPRSAGTSTFSIRVNDAGSRTAAQSFTLAVTDAQGPQITTGATLPRGTPGQAYVAQIGATGGRPPYRWSLSGGALPLGLAFDTSQARISGTPLQAGAFRFSVTVTDADNRSDARTFDLAIVTAGDLPFNITTATLPSANLGVAYQATFNAAGGAGAYRFLLRTGRLPAGLRLDGDSITGAAAELGTFSVGIRAVDGVGALADRDFVLTVGLLALPAVSVGGVPEILNPGQQSPVAVDLSRTYPVEVVGRLDLDFTSEPFVQGVDPALQFSTGGRGVEFRVPAGQTRAVFPQAPIGLQTGTVAGLMQIRVSLKVAGVDVPAENQPDRAVRVAATVPVISSASIEKSAGGFNLIVAGFSPTREVTEGVAVLTAAAGRQLESTRLTIPLTGAFRTWYDTQTSLPFGTQFRLVLPFTGDATAVESMTFTLRNQLGNSAEVKVAF